MRRSEAKPAPAAGAAGVGGAPGAAEGATGSAPGPAGEAELDRAALERWGRRLGARAAAARAFVALHGPLGAGKTALVQAACAGAGVREPVTSPTFTLVHEHRAGGLEVRHVDLYRIHDPAELDELGWEELVAGTALVFVEWAERASERLPPDRWEVRLALGSAPERRRVRVRAIGRAPSPPPPGDEDGR